MLCFLQHPVKESGTIPIVLSLSILSLLNLGSHSNAENCIDGFSITAMKDKVQLSWSHKPLAKKYEILRSDTLKGPFKRIAKASSKYLTHSVSSVRPGKIHYYKIHPRPESFSKDSCQHVILAAIPPSENTQMVYVPNVTGVFPEHAKNLLSQASLSWKIVKMKHRNNSPEDRIIRQDPPPESHVHQSFVVTLYQTAASPVHGHSFSGKTSKKVITVFESEETIASKQPQEKLDFLPINSSLILATPLDRSLTCISELNQFKHETANAKDKCPGEEPLITFSDHIQEGTCSDEKVITRTWTAENGCGGVTSKDQLITVQDLIPPEIQCPPDLKIVCGEDLDPENTGQAIAFDNCNRIPIVQFTDSEIGSCEVGKTVLRTWTARDRCENVSRCTQTISLEAPALVTITCPDDLVLGIDESINPERTGQPVGTDSKNSPLHFIYADRRSPGSCSQESQITRTWTATNRENVSSQCVQTLVVLDSAPPVFSQAPQNISADCDDIPTPLTLVASDNSNANIQVEFSETKAGSDNCSHARKIIRSWTAEDACGNRSRVDQIVNLRDSVPPVLHGVPPNILVEADAIPDPPSVTAIDSCEGEIHVNFRESIHGFLTCISDSGFEDAQKIIRTWNAEDSCGNRTTAEQIITVQDTTPPVFSQTLADKAAECNAIPEPSVVFASDNSGADVTFQFAESFTGSNLCIASLTDEKSRELKRVWTAADPCGNQSKMEQIITIVDMTPPRILSEPILEAEVGARYTYPILAEDNCSGNLKFSFDTFPVGMKIDGSSGLITWTPEQDQFGKHSVIVQVSDPCGHTVFHEFSLNVRIPMVKVPDLRGMKQAEALLVIKALDLVVGKVTLIKDNAASPNIIIDQVPQSGTKIYLGKKVDLTVSLDSNSGRVTDLVKTNPSTKEIPPKF